MPIATDEIWDSKGDIAVGEGSDMAQVLPIGANNQVLRVDTDHPAWEDEFDITDPETQALGDAASPGSADTAARRDHKHAMPAALATASGLTVSATDKVLGRKAGGGGAVEEIACTAAGRALLDDASAAEQRTTLSLGSMATKASTDYVANAAYNAHTILAADTDDTPQAVALAPSEMIGRKAAGGIVALAKADVQTIINVADGADVTADNAPKAHAASHGVGEADSVFPAAPDSAKYLQSSALGVLSWAASSTAAHKDDHDPEDGADPLDTAAAGEIVGVAAAAKGSSHSLARADHTHQIQAAITDDHILTVDDAAAADDDFARFTANGIEGIPAATALSALLAAIMGENDSLRLVPDLSADGTYSGFSIAGTAGTTLAFGDLCYFSPADSRWELADASAEATAANLLGFCVLAAANDGDSTRILLFGTIRADAAFPSLAIGAPAFISEDAGDITNTAPTTSGAIIRKAGHGLSANILMVNPCASYYEHV